MSQTFITNVDENNSDDEEDNNGVIEKSKNHKKGSLQFGGCSYKRAKKVVISPFNKIHKKLNKKPSFCSPNSHQISNLASNSNSNSNSNRISSYRRSGSYFGTCLCVSNTQTLDTDFEEFDPNDDPCVSFEYIKSLIENNDFYCKDCNTHVL